MDKLARESRRKVAVWEFKVVAAEERRPCARRRQTRGGHAVYGSFPISKYLRSPQPETSDHEHRNFFIAQYE